jgi:hypothetical protein
MHKYLLGVLLAFASATPVMFVSASPAEARPKVIHVPVTEKRPPGECPRGLVGRYPNCQKKATPAKGRCLKAVRDPGPGGSVKIKCVKWGSLPVAAASRG